MPVGVLIVSRDGCATGFPRPRAWLPRSVRSRQCVALFYLMMLGRSPGWRRIWSEPRHSLRRTRRTCPGKNEVRGEEASVRDKLLNPIIGPIADFDAVLPGFFPPDVTRVAWQPFRSCGTQARNQRFDPASKRGAGAPSGIGK